MANRVWVLGAQDPEMMLIENLLWVCGESVIYATDESGQRVHPGSAYRCQIPEIPKDSTVYAVECIDKLPPGWVRIDHHRPGDPGYGKPPIEFFSASSIGQVIAVLARNGIIPKSWRRMSAGYAAPLTPQYTEDGTPVDYVGVPWIRPAAGGRYAWDIVIDDQTFARVPQEIVLAAAADHCLAEAYRSKCPEVDPDELLHWRIKIRAAFQGRSEAELFADVWEAQDLLNDAPNERLAHGIYVADLRGYGHIPELPEAAMLEGVAYITLVADRDGRRKIVLGGHTTPEMVKAFMTEWSPKQGLVDIYGDPARGFAGGYLPDPNPA